MSATRTECPCPHPGSLHTTTVPQGTVPQSTVPRAASESAAAAFIGAACGAGAGGAILWQDLPSPPSIAPRLAAE